MADPVQAGSLKPDITLPGFGETLVLPSPVSKVAQAAIAQIPTEAQKGLKSITVTPDEGYKSVSPPAPPPTPPAPPPGPMLKFPSASASAGHPHLAKSLSSILGGAKLKKTTPPAIASTQAAIIKKTHVPAKAMPVYKGYDPAVAILHLEDSVTPVGRHPANFRQFQITMNGKPMMMALMAHPEKYGNPYGDGESADTGIGSLQAIKKVQAAGYHTLICLDHEDFSTIKDRWDKSSAEYSISTEINLMHMEDFTRPTLETFQKVDEIVAKSSAKGTNIIFYCGAGFGRSGVIAASVVLLENLRQIHQRGELSKEIPLKETTVLDIDDKPIQTTPEVSKAVGFVRTQDPENGTNLRARNARASLKGPTVEKDIQFNALEELEADFRAKLGK